jgi:hypothetical protein
MMKPKKADARLIESAISEAIMKMYLQNGRLTKEGLQRLKMCREAGALIDPETAEIKCEARPFSDPYGIYPDDPKGRHVTLHYFARSPESNIWVAWEDLPREVEYRLWRKHKQKNPALRHPLSCWSSFCHSPLFRKSARGTPINVNHVRYVRLICCGPSSTEEAQALQQATVAAFTADASELELTPQLLSEPSKALH